MSSNCFRSCISNCAALAWKLFFVLFVTISMVKYLLIYFHREWEPISLNRMESQLVWIECRLQHKNDLFESIYFIRSHRSVSFIIIITLCNCQCHNITFQNTNFTNFSFLFFLFVSLSSCFSDVFLFLCDSFIHGCLLFVWVIFFLQFCTF